MIKKMNGREKVLFLCTMILLLVISVKSVFLDAFKPSTFAEISLIEQSIEKISAKHDSALYSSGFFMTRVIEAKALEDGVIKVHYRKYVLYIFPFGDEYQEL